jgi:hypothetical protein
MKTMLFIFIFSQALVVQASIVDSLILRDHIEFNSALSDDLNTSKTIKLRTTRGIDQKDSLFCWAFTTANLLETSMLEKNLNLKPSDIELSRWFIENATPSIYKLGTVIDALYTYSFKIGYVRNIDYIRGSLQIPMYTTYNNKKMTPLQFRKLLIGEKVYWSYAISESKAGWGPHLDPDSTPGKESYYMPRADLAALIKKSLQNKDALGFWYEEHVVTLFGADFDDSGKAIKYYIKDSYWPYFYEADAEETHQIIIEITGISNLIN